MKNRIFKGITLITAPILILALAMTMMLRNVPDHLYTQNELEVMSVIPDMSPFGNVEYKNKKLNVNLLGVIPIKSVAVHKVKNIEVNLGGNCVGVRLSSKGALVVGQSEVNINNEKVESPATKVGIGVGDLIVKINNEKVESSKELISNVKNAKSDTVNITFIRNGSEMTKEVKLLKESGGDYKLGLWVRDSTAGVGTMTFYDEKSGKFAALGHPVTDGDTNKPFTIKDGDLLESSIMSVRKGEKGSPGELKGIFVDDNNPIGKIEKNTQCGIFGNTTTKIKNGMRSNRIKIGFRDEIKLGKASIITTVDESGPKEYEIEITKLLQQDEAGPKSMIIKVTDPELLKKTGGIVQGMSGSPIIQNGKLVGAVTHVLINKPDVGYGIYIDWMLEDAGIIK